MGTIIDGRYEVLDYLGEGGVARVYLARHLHMDRLVAIKLLNPESDEMRAKVFEDRFLLEAQIAASMRHPNIVNILDFGFTDPYRQPFLVMEHLEGNDLHVQIQREGPIKPERLLPLMVDCLDGLARGHKKGIVHKDLKPSNLFWTKPGTEDETLVVLDFGLARDDGLKEARKTRTGKITGTPQYMAPEYIQFQRVSPALDVYQMGLILCEALIGQAVVDDSNPYNCMVAHCEGSMEIPDDLLASPLGPVLEKAMAIDPDARYVDAGEFRDAVDAVDPAAVARAYTAQWPPPPRRSLSISDEDGDEPVRPRRSRISAPRPRTASSSPTPLVASAVSEPDEAPKPAGPLPQPTARTFNDPSLEDNASLPPALMAVMVVILVLGLAGAGAWVYFEFIAPADAPNVVVVDGDALMAQDKWDEAIAWYESELDKTPEAPGLEDKRALAQEGKKLAPEWKSFNEDVAAGRFEEASARLSKLDSDKSPYKTRIDEATRTKVKAGAIDKLLKLARTSLAARKWKEGRQAAERALELAPANEEAKTLVKLARAKRRP